MLLFLLFGRGRVFFLLFGRGPRPRPNSKKKKNTTPPKQQKNKKKHAPGPSERVFFCLGGWVRSFVFAVWAWVVLFFFAVWAGGVFFFCCLGGGVFFFCCLGGGVFFFLLFGPGACFFFCCLGGGREFTHLPVCLARLLSDPTTKDTKQQKKTRVPIPHKRVGLQGILLHRPPRLHDLFRCWQSSIGA